MADGYEYLILKNNVSNSICIDLHNWMIGYSVYRKDALYIHHYLTGKMNGYDFTGREKIIVTHIFSGFGNEAIASMLRISPETVKRHIYNIYTKTGVKNRTGLVFKILSM